MTLKQAIETLNFYGKQRATAQAANVAWLPDRAATHNIREAYNVLLASESVEAQLNQAGRALYEAESIRLQEDQL